MADVDTNAETVDRIIARQPLLMGDPPQENDVAKTLSALLTERDHYKARAGLAAPKVKPLAWCEHNWIASTGFGYVRIEHKPAGWWNSLTKSYEPTMHAAKAAAQADRERRILEALEPGSTLADAYRAGLNAAADKVMNEGEEFTGMRKGEMSKLLSRSIRALPVPPEFGGE